MFFAQFDSAQPVTAVAHHQNKVLPSSVKNSPCSVRKLHTNEISTKVKYETGELNSKALILVVVQNSKSETVYKARAH